MVVFFFFSSRRRHTRLTCDWSSDVCSSDLEPLVEREPLLYVAAVARGQQRRDVEIDLGIEIEILFERRRAARLQCAHRALEHAGVEREADFLDLARLRFAENLAGAADLQVVHREVEAGAEL